MKKILAALAVLLCAASLALAAPDAVFTAQGIDGGTYTQEIFKGARLTMLNVWGTFCPPCLREMPDLGALARDMKPAGVQVVGVVCDWYDRNGNYSASQVEKARKIAARTGADYPHLLLNGDLLKIFGPINAVPQTFFFDAEGNIVGSVTGAQSGEAWKETIHALLQ